MDAFNHFPEISKKLHKAMSQAVRKTALDVQKDAATNAPVDTGFLRNSIYTAGAWGSTYGRGIQEAKAPKPGKKGFVSRRQLQNFVKRRERQRTQESMLFDQVPPPPDDQSAYVIVGAMYGIYVELGTRYQRPQPYFYPAVDRGQTALTTALERVAATIESEHLSGMIEEAL